MTVAMIAHPRLLCDSPYDLRLGPGCDLSEGEIRTAVATGGLGFIHSFATGSALNGPGVRVVAWTTGCKFRCEYCHNPDAWSLSAGAPVTVGRAVEELKKYAHGLRMMGGGFTLSGGEPLLQSRFAARLFAAVSAIGVHTAMETSGAYGHRLADDELANIDLVILDMKAFTADQHRRVTGGEDNAPVLDFCRRLADLGRPMWLRYLVVPGLTDDRDEMAAVAAFAADLGVVQRVEVLPFHQMGRYKWERLGLEYRLAGTLPPTPRALDDAVDIFRAAGLDTY